MSYFINVFESTPTRFWVNNPNMDEMEKSIAAGVVGVTTNPAYCSKLIKSEPEYIRDVIDGVIKDTKDNDTAADIIYQLASKRIMDTYLPMYKASNGTNGFVTIQLDPREDNKTEAIIEAVKRHSKLGENYMAKIPVTAPGCKAIEATLRMGIPVCATEVFTISQAIYVCELHDRVCKEIGKEVPMYVTHITGIFDEYLERYAHLNGIDINLDFIKQAGCAVGRKQYHLLKEKGYKAIMLGGGARGTQHFSEFVGGDMHITINWSTAQELIEMNEQPVSRIDTQTSDDVIKELSSKLADFNKAYDVDGLKPEEFENYGPVQLFKNIFVEGYYALLTEISARRIKLLV